MGEPFSAEDKNEAMYKRTSRVRLGVVETYSYVLGMGVDQHQTWVNGVMTRTNEKTRNKYLRCGWRLLSQSSNIFPKRHELEGYFRYLILQLLTKN